MRRKRQDRSWTFKLGLLLWANAVWVVTLAIAILGPLKLAWLLSWSNGFFGLGWPWIQLAALSLGFWWASSYSCEGEIFKSVVCSVLCGGALLSLILGSFPIV